MKALAPIIALLGLFTQACDRQPKTAHPPEPKTVLATVYPVAEVAKEVGGDRVKIEWFLESGQSLAEIQPTVDQRNSVRTADLVITRGPSETWMLGGIDDPFGAKRIIRLETFASAQSASPRSYIWLDPQVARELSEEVAKRLSAVDAANENLYQSNRAQFQKQLDAICDDAHKRLDAISEKTFLCTSGGFSAFVLRFGVIEAITSVEPADTLLPQRIGKMRDLGRAMHAKAIFVPDGMPTGVARDLSERVGLPVLTLDPLGSSAPSGRNTYLKLLRYNLDQLIKGLGGT